MHRSSGAIHGSLCRRPPVTITLSRRFGLRSRTGYSTKIHRPWKARRSAGSFGVAGFAVLLIALPLYRAVTATYCCVRAVTQHADGWGEHRHRSVGTSTRTDLASPHTHEEHRHD